MKTISRLLRHLCTNSRSGQRAFPAPTLKAIEAAIAEGETRHRAEVRLIIEAALNAQAVLGGMTARERARELFAHYRIWDTEENCGVLVYINLADHQVEIVADRGVGRAIAANDWQGICRMMTAGFARGDFHHSVLSALGHLHDLLAAHFPDDGSSRNQLPDRPVIL
ncbi:TPM domain-containing protein [Noviherbaspirillum massiliense]|uniref:TPM domain-containing protein n=1 Tax=Noviherbaspirillum massiliense TaxID=1465823 RepID=UPI00030454CC|nr:TPM domain-containing protein [Noviherbaspirillum massiliense]